MGLTAFVLRGGGMLGVAEVGRLQALAEEARAFVGTGDSTGAVADLAAGLKARDALLIYPEGSDWTPTRHRRAVTRLRRRGLKARADAAAARPHVLPPRPGGTFAAQTAAPQAQVAMFVHTGHDDMLELGALWRALPLRRKLHLVWWGEARPNLEDEGARGVWSTGCGTRSTPGSPSSPPCT